MTVFESKKTKGDLGYLMKLSWQHIHGFWAHEKALGNVEVRLCNLERCLAPQLEFRAEVMKALQQLVDSIQVGRCSAHDKAYNDAVTVLQKYGVPMEVK